MKEPTDSTSDLELSILKSNLAGVQQRIQNACFQSGRSSDSVRMVAVTKYAEWSWVKNLATVHSTFGENRPQQLIERQKQLPQIDWHLIGQLQRNKVKSVLPHCSLIHSVDSSRLFHKIADVADELQVKPKVLIQVNVSGEASKSGLSPQELTELLPEFCRRQSELRVLGLMTMAPANQNPKEARQVFGGLRQLRDSLVEKQVDLPETWSLDELSMGMSGDFEIAIEEGATIVRVGSALFKGLVDSSATV